MLDSKLLRRGLNYWKDRCDVVLVEGAGGLLSPMGDRECVADLAHDFSFPLVVVSRNVLGTINATLQTLFTARHYRGGLSVAGVVLNHPSLPPASDVSVTSNRAEMAARCAEPLLAAVEYGAKKFDCEVDWPNLAR